MKVKNRLNIVFASFVLIVLFASCYENVEGCLDINATNFQVDADIECDDCCEFPQLYLKIAHKKRVIDSTANFLLNNPYSLSYDEDSLFVISNIKYYLSNIELLRTDGTYLSVIDSTALTYLDGTDSISAYFKNDIVQVNRASDQTYLLGSFPYFGSFYGVRFNFGLDDELKQIIPESCPSGHPLNFQSDSLNYMVGSGYNVCQINLKRDTASDISAEWLLFDDSFSFQNFNDLDFEIPNGVDIYLTIRIDYLNWFDGIDMRRASPEEIKTLIAQNLKNSIYVLKLEVVKRL